MTQINASKRTFNHARRGKRSNARGGILSGAMAVSLLAGGCTSGEIGDGATRFSRDSGRGTRDVGGMGGTTSDPSGGTTTSGGTAGQGTDDEAGSGAAGNGSVELTNPPVTNDPNRFLCRDNQEPEATPLRRLSFTQFENTYRDLLTWGLGDRERAENIVSELAPKFELVPRDERKKFDFDPHGTYTRLDQRVQENHINSWYDVAVAAGTALSADGVLERLVGECANDSGGGDACLTDFVEKFASRAFRAPVDSDQIALLAGFYGDADDGDREAWADVIAAVLASPEFLYHMEFGDQKVDGMDDTYRLSSYELAARLSYHYWNTLPDDELWEMAKSGDILDPGLRREKIVSMVDDDRARSMVRGFFRDTMKVDELKDLTEYKDDPAFQAFAGDDLPDANLRKDMQDEVVNILEYITFEQNGSFQDVLTTRLAMPGSEDLARIYGLDNTWQPGDEPLEFDQPERTGIYTRAAFLTSGEVLTSPILKGLYIKEQVLCEEMEIPDPQEVEGITPVEPSNTRSTKESTVAKTEDPDGQCVSCHAQFNGFGYATEVFDSLGRYRTEETLFGEEGDIVGMAELDPSGDAPGLGGDDNAKVDGPLDMMTKIAQSGQMEACMTRHYTRYTLARWDSRQDNCMMESVRQESIGGKTIKDMLVAIGMTPAFAQRKIVE